MKRTKRIIRNGITLCLAIVAGTACVGLKDHRTQNEPLQSLMQEIAETENRPLQIQKQGMIRNYEDFLQKYGHIHPDLRADALKRLGDLSLQASQQRYMTQMENYEKQPEASPPLLDYDKTIQSYQELLSSYPDFQEKDQVLYALARTFTETGRKKEGVQYLLQLIHGYPQSRHLQEAYFRLGEYFFDQQDYPAAAHAYEESLKGGDPFFIDKTRYKLGWTYFNLEDYPSAVQEFLWLLDEKTDPGYDLTEQNVPLTWEALTYTSLSFRHMGGPQKTAQYFRERGPRHYEKYLYLSMGNQYMSSQDIENGIWTYQTFMQEHPLHPMAPVFASYILETEAKRGNQEAALKTRLLIVEQFNTEGAWYQANDVTSQNRAKPLVRDALHHLALDAHRLAQKSRKDDDYRESIRWYQFFMKEFPDDPEKRKIHFLLAEALYDTAQFSAAAAAYETVAFHDPSSELDPKAAYSAIVSFEKAGGHDNLQKVVELVQSFADAFPKDPRSPDLLLKSAEILLDQSEPAKSEIVLNKFLERYPKGTLAPNAYRQLAYIYTEQGRYEAARDAYRQAKNMTPVKDTEAHRELTGLLASVLFKLGELHKASQRPLDAAKAYQAVSVEAPFHALAPVALLEAGTLYETLDQPQNAVNIYKHLVQTASDSPYAGKARIRIGALYEQQGDKRKAAAAYQSAVPHVRDPAEQAQLLWHSAQLLEESAQWDQLGDILSEYVKRFPQDEKIPEALFKKAVAYQMTGKEKEALALFEKVETQAPGTLPAAQAALKRAEAAYKDYKKLRLKEPIVKSLKQKTGALERVVTLYAHAAESRFADVVTVSAYRMGEAFEHYRSSLLEAPLPKGISPDMEEEYRFQVEEKAYPFEEKAIEAYQSNVKRIYEDTVIYNDWIRKSYERLAELRPSLYRRPEETEKIAARIDPFSLPAQGTTNGDSMRRAQR